jgi:hypothetical protein
VAQWPAEKLVFAVASGLGVGYAVCFAGLCASHALFFDGAGHPMLMDFTQFWAAGSLALHGNGIGAYDPRFLHAAESAAVGHPLPHFIEWFYPPSFLFVAMALAYFPALTAFILWTTGTLVVQASIVAGIAKRGAAAFVATAPPWVMLGTLTGQDGLFSAAIIGGVLLTLERRPVLSGILLGLLSYKPQLGVLFPVALAFGGYWRAFFWACVSTAGLLALSGATFGFATWAAFLHGLSGAAQMHLATNDAAMWPKIQSAYGLARWLGGSYGLAMTLQMLLSAACLIFIARLWRSQAAYALKAAALVAAVPLVTPYEFAYDLPVLSVAIAFLYRDGPFDRTDWFGLAVALVSVGIFVMHAYPAGLLASGAVGALVCRRLWREKMCRNAANRTTAVAIHAPA